MDYEYVALTWVGQCPEADELFASDMDTALRQGWEALDRGSFGKRRSGGAVIMRRPKDEPRMWTEKQRAVEEVRFVQEAKFSAVLPSIVTAIRIHGDSGVRIQLDILDTDVCELEVTVRPVPK